jgi:iron(III) transport system ATP-binding protein
MKPARSRKGVPVVEVTGVTVRYGVTVAVREASLEVERGSLTALLGESGCGKTSLLRAIAGFEAPVSGRILLDGVEVAGPGRWVPPERRQVGMVFQEGALFPHLTVEGNVRYGLDGHRDAADRTAAALDLVGLRDLAGRYPDELSGGQQQRVALARALAPSPRVVLLDEPFANLDAALRQRVREEVRAILARAGATGLLVTHDQDEALSVADRVAVMGEGQVLQVGSPEEVYALPASVAVARFLGDGQLLPCRIQGGWAHSPFGSVGAVAPDGPALLLVRPEDFVLMPPAFQQGRSARVVARRFFGHDLIQEVELESGERFHIRLLSSTPFIVGDRVRVCLRPQDLPVFSPQGEGERVGHVEVRLGAVEEESAARR